MDRIRGIVVRLVIGLTLVAAVARPAAADGPRKLVYPAECRGDLKKVVDRLTREGEPEVPDRAIQRQGLYARVVPADRVLADGKLKDGAWLGPRPFVFLTAPEGLYGKPLLRVFADIGRTADDVLTGAANREFVAVVFRYPDPVAFHDGPDGTLPGGWADRGYSPTWAAAAALFEKLAAAAAIEPDADAQRFTPDRLTLRSDRERGFAVSFPDAGLRRVARTSYSSLHDAGGADWAYRSLLESKLGLSEHFTGKGRTRPAIGRAADRLGLPEWVGPNRKLASLPEVAVVSLGTVRLGE